MLRHRRQRWAAMDFLLASYRKQKKWVRLRQLLLLLSRLAIALILIALLCGWTGSRGLLDVLGGRTTHHVVILDDSYSMGDQSVGGADGEVGVFAIAGENSDATVEGGVSSAYRRALATIQDLTRNLAGQEGEHQLTVMRSSRAAMSVRGGSQSGDVAADLSSQTISEDARLVNRLMATTASPTPVDMIPAIDLASELIDSTPADEKYLYIVSDFRQREWNSADRIAESLQGIGGDVEIRLVDCAAEPSVNLGITALSPSPDVWVAGVPLVVRVTVKNFSEKTVANVPVTIRVIQYPESQRQVDPSVAVSGEVETLPELMIDSLAGGEEITKTFQVYVAQSGTHAIQADLPSDALAIDNRRYCTLPLSKAERVLIIDSDVDTRGAYHVSSVLNPGSQVSVGAIPEVQPPSFLRSIDYETLSGYRAVYLIDLQEISDNAADALSEYVRRGGGVCWFLGDKVDASSYNQTLLGGQRRLLPAPLTEPVPLEERADSAPGDLRFTDGSDLLGPLRSGGDGVLALVGLTKSWGLQLESEALAETPELDYVSDFSTILTREDGLPILTQHEFGRGRILTAMMGLNGQWTNWPGDPSFVVFLLQANAWLWSAASPPVSRLADDAYEKRIDASTNLRQATFLPPSIAVPRIPFQVEGEELKAERASDSDRFLFRLDPSEMLIRGDEHVEDVLQPGLAEWGFMGTDGLFRVTPEASVVLPSDGELSRVDHGVVLQQLTPLNVQFIERRSWNQEAISAGSSSMALLLILILGVFLAIEQALAYWASYHVKSVATQTTTGKSVGMGFRSTSATQGGSR